MFHKPNTLMKNYHVDDLRGVCGWGVEWFSSNQKVGGSILIDCKSLRIQPEKITFSKNDQDTDVRSPSRLTHTLNLKNVHFVQDMFIMSVIICYFLLVSNVSMCNSSITFHMHNRRAKQKLSLCKYNYGPPGACGTASVLYCITSTNLWKPTIQKMFPLGLSLNIQNSNIRTWGRKVCIRTSVTRSNSKLSASDHLK